jgi:signal transduction histidine kinase
MVTARGHGFIVQDTGEGIPDSDLPHTFERFYQVSSARSSGGCGLGLSICRWIVGAHGGVIEVENDEASGTIITVTLPDAKSDSPAGPGHREAVATVVGDTVQAEYMQ